MKSKIYGSCTRFMAGGGTRQEQALDVTMGKKIDIRLSSMINVEMDKGRVRIPHTNCS